MTEVTHHRKTLKDRFIKTGLRKSTGDEKASTFPLHHLPKMIAYRIFRWVGELTAIVLGLACVWFAVINSLMIQQSVDISGLKPNAQMWFSEAFNGSDAQIGNMKLQWIPASNNFLFEATDVVISDDKGQKIETIKRLQTELPLAVVSKGIFTTKHVLIEGGVVTLLREENGNVVAGLGTPETVGKLGSFLRSRAGGQKTTFPKIESVKIIDATAYVLDNRDGLELTFNETNIDFAQNVDGVEVAVSSSLEKGTTKRPLKLNIKASNDFRDYTVDVVTQGLNPSILSPKRGRYTGLKGLNAELDIKAMVAVGRDKGLRLADINIDVGQGRFEFEEFKTEFNKANLEAVLSAEAQNMDITSIGLSSEKLSFSGEGSLSELGALTDGNINSSPVFNLMFENVLLDHRPTMSHALTFSRLDMKGRLDLDDKNLELDRLRADLRGIEYELKGNFSQDQSGQWDRIGLEARANGTLGREDLLSIWPVKFVKGARDWIANSILKASLNNLTLKADFGETALREGKFQDEDVLMTFDVANADVKYIKTMTPYTNVSGKGTLRGDSLHFDAVGGNVGPLDITKAVVDIPRLQPFGGDLIIKLNGNGTTSDILALVDQKPFEFPTQFGVKPEEFGGKGVIDMTITRPLLVFFDQDRIKYDIIGTFSDVSAPIDFGAHKVKNGQVTLKADKTGMTIKGPINIGPWQTDLTWRKTFDYGNTPTTYQVVGSMDRDTLDGFGIGFREYFEGNINLSIDALGDGLNITSADVVADLSDTSIQIADYWRKEKGSPAEFKGQLQRQLDGGVRLESMQMRASGLDITGSIKLADNFRLLDLDLSRAEIAGFIDAAVQVKPDELNQKLSVFVTGKYLNLSSIVESTLSSAGGSFNIPILLTAGLDKLALHKAYTVDGANLLFSHNGTSLTNARLGGQTDKGPIKVQMRSLIEENVREVDVDIPDASDAARAFLNLDSIEGGRLEITAQLPPIGQAGALTGVAKIDEFKLVKAPILAQMLSVGSLTGLFDTLNGEGMSFDTFNIPFSLRDGEINVRNARVSGPALGMTGDGDIRFKDRLIDLDGALVPAYTANSLLGDIPVLGNLLVGNKGEGIFALSYTVQGPFDEVQVAVNPLAALTPGFLRGIFKPKRNKLPEETLEEIKSVVPN